MWHKYINASSLEEALQALQAHGEKARIVAGGTDLILELERGVRKGVDTLIDVTRIPHLDQITHNEDNIIHLGPLVTHNHCVASSLIRERAYPLAKAAWEVGAPQIRNRGTVAGNLITGSPANDTITPLMVLDASVTLRAVNGSRTVPLKDFYTGVRKTIMRPDEMLVDISFPALTASQRGTFIKLALRRAQAISVINVALVLTMQADSVRTAAITLGAVAPTIIHAPKAEAYLIGKTLSDEVIAEAARLTMQAAQPIDDVRGSAAYRREMVRVCTGRGLRSLRNGEEQAGTMAEAVLLWNRESVAANPVAHESPASPIVTTVNGQQYTSASGHEKTLLRFLREDLGLIGSKEGCAEGECGACTVFLDGKAVMACLVPAPRAHGAVITTVEGLEESEGRLHPVQEAFVQHGAVQCGYCTPGFVMSAAMVLDEKQHPTRNAIEQALTGNLCRCTGYYKIVDAIVDASKIRSGGE